MGNAEHKDGLQEKGRKKKFVSEKGYQSITEVRSGLQDKNKGEVFTMTSLFLYKNKISTNKKHIVLSSAVTSLLVVHRLRKWEFR